MWYCNKLDFHHSIPGTDKRRVFRSWIQAKRPFDKSQHWGVRREGHLTKVNTGKRIGNFAEGAKFSVFRCLRQAFLTSIMLFMMLLLYNIKGNFAEGEKIGAISPKAKNFGFFPVPNNYPLRDGGGDPLLKT